jgi:hypothetical protein
MVQSDVTETAPPSPKASGSPVSRLILAYAGLLILTAGLCVALAFMASAVGANARLLGLASLPFGLATGLVLWSPSFRTRPLARPAGAGVTAVVLGSFMARRGGDLGGLILLGFVTGLFLWLQVIATQRILGRMRARVSPVSDTA